MKNRTFFFRYIINTFFSSLFLQGALFAQKYAWPIHATHMLSGTFAEYRSGHFHAGIDFKTMGQDGYPVYAVESGYVSRIIISPFEGGKSLFLKLNDGLSVTYIHLEKFVEPLETLIRQEQLKRDRYRVEKWFTPGEFSFQRGELIAFSGHTGTKYSHLHFEVSDSLGHFFNPLYLGYAISDTIPPDIIQISATPLNKESHVNRDFQPVLFQPEKLSPGIYFISDTINFDGHFGLACHAYDRANGAPNQNGIFSSALYLNDVLIFSAVYDTLTDDVWQLTYFDWDYRFQKRGSGRFRKLYVDYKNSLPFYRSQAHQDGIIRNDSPVLLAKSFHEIRLEISDFWGNQSIVFATVQLFPIEEAAVNHPVDIFDHSSSCFTYDFYDDYIRFQFKPVDGQHEHKSLQVFRNFWSYTEIPLYPKGKSYVCRYPLSGSVNEWIIPAYFGATGQFPLDTIFVQSISPGNNELMRSEDGYFQVEFTKDDLYKPLYGEIVKEYIWINSIDSIQGYQIRTNDFPLRNPCTIRMQPEDLYLHKDRLAIYSVNPEGKLSYLESHVQGKWLTARTRHLGQYVILQDTILPKIHRFYPSPNETITEIQPDIHVWFSDSLSGISGEDNYRVYLDGISCIVQYDYAWDVGNVQIDDPLSPGKHELLFVICDRAGNEARERSFFYIR